MTIRQRKLKRNIGNSRSLEQAMLKSGYAASTAHQQTTITKSKTFEQIVEDSLINEEVVKIHKEGLYAMKIHGTNDNFIEIPDYPSRLKAVELAYRAKGKLKDNVVNNTGVVMNVVLIRDERQREAVENSG